MKSTTLAFILLIATASAFTIVNSDTPNDVNWPFAICGTFEGWEAKNLTLTARNMNDTVDLFGIATDYVEFDKVDVLVKFNGFSFTVKQLTGTLNMMLEIQLSINIWLLLSLLLLQEITSCLSHINHLQENRLDVGVSHSKYDMIDIYDNSMLLFNNFHFL